MATNHFLTGPGMILQVRNKPTRHILWRIKREYLKESVVSIIFKSQVAVHTLVFERFCVCIFWQWDSLPCQGILENGSNHLKRKSKYRLSKSKCLSKLSLFYVQIYILTHKNIPSKKDHPKISIQVLPTKNLCFFFPKTPKKTSHPLESNHPFVGIPGGRSLPPLGRPSRPRPKGRDVGKAIRNLCAMALYAELQQPVVPKEATVEAVNPFRGDRRVVRGFLVGGFLLGLKNTLVDQRVGFKNGRDNFSCWVFLCVCVFVFVVLFWFFSGGVVEGSLNRNFRQYGQLKSRCIAQQ